MKRRFITEDGKYEQDLPPSIERNNFFGDSPVRPPLAVYSFPRPAQVRMKEEEKKSEEEERQDSIFDAVELESSEGIDEELRERSPAPAAMSPPFARVHSRHSNVSRSESCELNENIQTA